MPQLMVVDDEPDLRELVSITLTRGGHEVLTAENGEEVLKTLESKRPHLLLLDINMPELDGWETLDEMEKRGITREVPVMMFTVEKLTFVKMLRKDIENLVGYIEKPFTRTELIDTVEKTLDKTQQMYRLKNKIMKSQSGGEDLAEAFLAWYRHQMIHERLLEKLEEMKDDFVDDQKLARVENLIRGEEQTIEEARQKKIEVLRLADLESVNV